MLWIKYFLILLEYNMNIMKLRNVLYPFSFGMIATGILLLSSCKKEAGPVPKCGVQLFDGENYKDDFANLDGSGSYANLNNLPNTDINWDNEADAIKTGTNSTVTLWDHVNFQGDSLVLQPGSEEPKLNFSMRSMRIVCQ